ncbi:conserved Plasmodium protein, unknown function [Plasmodium relictum]|uniref:Uncharacterized protein n=1 Tax=Plasmodium relictum TaxID=85471 RepID=A0A1J1H8Q2_PLARL|nr:conserved Plasmodium protein, unknown function [Plasmodium relictum]CRH01037.1 conserved Plasmodium protein, unknown function [Plasmodium relictum]
MILFKRNAESVCLCKYKNKEYLILAKIIVKNSPKEKKDSFKGILIKKYNSSNFKLEKKKISKFVDIIDFNNYDEKKKIIKINGMFYFTSFKKDKYKETILCIILSSFFLLFFSIKNLTFLHFTTLKENYSESFKENSIFNWFLINNKKEFFNCVLFIQKKRQELEIYFLYDYIKSKGVRGYNKYSLFFSDYLICIEKIKYMNNKHIESEGEENYIPINRKNNFSTKKKKKNINILSSKIYSSNRKSENNIEEFSKNNKPNIFHKRRYCKHHKNDKFIKKRIINLNIKYKKNHNRENLHSNNGNEGINYSENIYESKNNRENIKLKKSNNKIIKQINTKKSIISFSTVEILEENIYYDQKSKQLKKKVDKVEKKSRNCNFMKKNKTKKNSDNLSLENAISYTKEENNTIHDKFILDTLKKKFSSVCIHGGIKKKSIKSFKKKKNYYNLFLVTKKLTFYVYKLCCFSYIFKYCYCVIDLSKDYLYNFPILGNNTLDIFLNNKYNYQNTQSYDYFNLSNETVQIKKNFFTCKQLKNNIYVSICFNKNILGIASSNGKLYFYELSYIQEKFICNFLQKCDFNFSLISFIWIKKQKNKFLFTDNCNKIYIGELIYNNTNNTYSIAIYNSHIKLNGDIFFTLPNEFFCKKKKSFACFFSLSPFFLTFYFSKNKFYIIILNLYSKFLKYPFYKISSELFIHNNQLYEYRNSHIFIHSILNRNINLVSIIDIINRKKKYFFPLLRKKILEKIEKKNNVNKKKNSRKQKIRSFNYEFYNKKKNSREIRNNNFSFALISCYISIKKNYPNKIIKNHEEMFESDILLIKIEKTFQIFYIFKNSLNACFFNRRQIVLLKRNVFLNECKTEDINIYSSHLFIFTIYDNCILNETNKYIKQKVQNVFTHSVFNNILFMWSADKGGKLFYTYLKNYKNNNDKDLKLKSIFNVIKNKNISIPIQSIQWKKYNNTQISLIILTPYYLIIFFINNCKSNIIVIEKIIKFDFRKVFGNGILIESLKIKKKENLFALSTCNCIYIFSYNDFYEKIYLKALRRLQNKKIKKKKKHLILKISSKSLTYVILQQNNYPLLNKIKSKTISKTAKNISKENIVQGKVIIGNNLLNELEEKKKKIKKYLDRVHYKNLVQIKKKFLLIILKQKVNYLSAYKNNNIKHYKKVIKFKELYNCKKRNKNYKIKKNVSIRTSDGFFSYEHIFKDLNAYKCKIAQLYEPFFDKNYFSIRTNYIQKHESSDEESLLNFFYNTWINNLSKNTRKSFENHFDKPHFSNSLLLESIVEKMEKKKKKKNFTFQNYFKKSMNSTCNFSNNYNENIIHQNRPQIKETNKKKEYCIKPLGLVVYYRCTEGSKDILNDASGCNRTATLKNYKESSSVWFYKLKKNELLINEDKWGKKIKENYCLKLGGKSNCYIEIKSDDCLELLGGSYSMNEKSIEIKKEIHKNLLNENNEGFTFEMWIGIKEEFLNKHKFSNKDKKKHICLVQKGENEWNINLIIDKDKCYFLINFKQKKYQFDHFSFEYLRSIKLNNYYWSSISIVFNLTIDLIYVILSGNDTYFLNMCNNSYIIFYNSLLYPTNFFIDNNKKLSLYIGIKPSDGNKNGDEENTFIHNDKNKLISNKNKKYSKEFISFLITDIRLFATSRSAVIVIKENKAILTGDFDYEKNKEDIRNIKIKDKNELNNTHTHKIEQLIDDSKNKKSSFNSFDSFNLDNTKKEVYDYDILSNHSNDNNKKWNNKNEDEYKKEEKTNQLNNETKLNKNKWGKLIPEINKKENNFFKINEEEKDIKDKFSEFNNEIEEIKKKFNQINDEIKEKEKGKDERIMINNEEFFKFDSEKSNDSINDFSYNKLSSNQSYLSNESLYENKNCNKINSKIEEKKSNEISFSLNSISKINKKENLSEENYNILQTDKNSNKEQRENKLNFFDEINEDKKNNELNANEEKSFNYNFSKSDEVNDKLLNFNFSNDNNNDKENGYEKDPCVFDQNNTFETRKYSCDKNVSLFDDIHKYNKKDAKLKKVISKDLKNENEINLKKESKEHYNEKYINIILNEFKDKLKNEFFDIYVDKIKKKLSNSNIKKEETLENIKYQSQNESENENENENEKLTINYIKSKYQELVKKKEFLEKKKSYDKKKEELKKFKEKSQIEKEMDDYIKEHQLMNEYYIKKYKYDSENSYRTNRKSDEYEEDMSMSWNNEKIAHLKNDQSNFIKKNSNSMNSDKSDFSVYKKYKLKNFNEIDLSSSENNCEKKKKRKEKKKEKKWNKTDFMFNNCKKINEETIKYEESKSNEISILSDIKNEKKEEKKQKEKKVRDNIFSFSFENTKKKHIDELDNYKRNLKNGNGIDTSLNNLMNSKNIEENIMKKEKDNDNTINQEDINIGKKYYKYICPLTPYELFIIKHFFKNGINLELKEFRNKSYLSSPMNTISKYISRNPNNVRYIKYKIFLMKSLLKISLKYIIEKKYTKALKGCIKNGEYIKNFIRSYCILKTRKIKNDHKYFEFYLNLENVHFTMNELKNILKSNVRNIIICKILILINEYKHYKYIENSSLILILYSILCRIIVNKKLLNYVLKKFMLHLFIRGCLFYVQKICEFFFLIFPYEKNNLIISELYELSKNSFLRYSTFYNGNKFALINDYHLNFENCIKEFSPEWGYYIYTTSNFNIFSSNIKFNGFLKKNLDFSLISEEKYEFLLHTNSPIANNIKTFSSIDKSSSNNNENNKNNNNRRDSSNILQNHSNLDNIKTLLKVNKYSQKTSLLNYLLNYEKKKRNYYIIDDSLKHIEFSRKKTNYNLEKKVQLENRNFSKDKQLDHLMDKVTHDDYLDLSKYSYKNIYLLGNCPYCNNVFNFFTRSCNICQRFVHICYYFFIYCTYKYHCKLCDATYSEKCLEKFKNGFNCFYCGLFFISK